MCRLIIKNNGKPANSFFVAREDVSKYKCLKENNLVNVKISAYFICIFLSFARSFHMSYTHSNIINLLIQKCVCEMTKPTVQCHS